MMVVGGIIGSGIFLNPAVVAQRAGTAGLTIAAWLLGGAVAVLGAFIYAELGGRRPEAGGGYAYLRDAFGPLPAFLYAWTLLLIIATGAIAAVAMTFASYAGAVVGLPATAITPMALGAIVLLTGINILGVKPSAVMTALFTILKLAALGLLILAGLAAMLGKGSLPTPVMLPLARGSATVALAGALVPVLFAYGGWQQTNFVAEEMVDAPAQPSAGTALGRGYRGGGVPAGECRLPEGARRGRAGGQHAHRRPTPCRSSSGPQVAPSSRSASRSRPSGSSTSPSAPMRASTRPWHATASSSMRSRRLNPRFRTPLRGTRGAGCLGRGAGALRHLRRTARLRGFWRLDFLRLDGGDAVLLPAAG